MILIQSTATAVKFYRNKVTDAVEWSAQAHGKRVIACASQADFDQVKAWQNAMDAGTPEVAADPGATPPVAFQAAVPPALIGNKVVLGELGTIALLNPDDTASVTLQGEWLLN